MEASKIDGELVKAIFEHLKDVARDPDLYCIHCKVKRPAYPQELTIRMEGDKFVITSCTWEKLDYDKSLEHAGWWAFTNPPYEDNADHEVAFCPQCVKVLDLHKS